VLARTGELLSYEQEHRALFSTYACFFVVQETTLPQNDKIGTDVRSFSAENCLWPKSFSFLLLLVSSLYRNFTKLFNKEFVEKLYLHCNLNIVFEKKIPVFFAHF